MGQNKNNSRKATKKQETARQRIFDSAVRLFARRGYGNIGIREIARSAGVQISMINYYYDGKIGILRRIVNETYEKYFAAVLNIGDEKTPLEKRINILVKNLVDFFRLNTELAIAGISAMPLDIPEITDLRIRWITDNRAALNRLFREMGLDTANGLQMSVVRSFLTNIIYGHFEQKYAWDQIVKAPAKPKLLPELEELNGVRGMSEDAFYQQYAEMLARFYLHGMQSIARNSGNSNNKSKFRK